MMAGNGLMFLLSIMAGGGNLDLVAAVPAKEYFAARNIDVKVERLMELAVQTPDSPKKQIEQLVALRHLTTNPDLLKKADKLADHRATLKEIAAGKKAADRSGFAAEYALKALAVLDGAKVLASRAPTSWKEDGLQFFPEGATLAGLFETRTAKTSEAPAPDLGPMLALMPKEMIEEAFTAAEKIGNVRLERVSFAYTEGGAIHARILGKANPEWMASMFEKFGKIEETSAADGVKIRIIKFPNDAPAVAIVGDAEIWIAGFPPEVRKKGVKAAEIDHRPALDEMLALRSKPGKSVLQGGLKERFAKIPAEATSLLVGMVPKEMRQAPFPMPVMIEAHGVPSVGGLDLKITGEMEDEDKAKAFVQTVSQGRDAALKELAKLQGQPLPIPGLNINTLINMLESIQIQPNGAAAQMRLLVPEEFMMTYPMLLLGGMGLRG